MTMSILQDDNNNEMKKNYNIPMTLDQCNVNIEGSR